MYGDRQINIVTVKNNLKGFQPEGNQRWEKVIELFVQVEKCVDQLRVMNAEVSLADDFELMSVLFGKLHVDYQEEWDSVIKRQEEQIPVWTKFQEFLEDKNDRALQSRLRNMSDKTDNPL